MHKGSHEHRQAASRRLRPQQLAQTVPGTVLTSHESPMSWVGCQGTPSLSSPQNCGPPNVGLTPADPRPFQGGHKVRPIFTTTLRRQVPCHAFPPEYVVWRVTLRQTEGKQENPAVLCSDRH